MVKVLINIDVDDLPRAEAFYTAAFQLKVGRRFGDQAVELTGAEAPFYLLLKAVGTSPFSDSEQGRDYQRHWTPVHLDFVVEDLEAAVARAVAAGAKTEGKVTAHGWGRNAYLSDPFGHGFCILQLSERGYDALATPT